MDKTIIFFSQNQWNNIRLSSHHLCIKWAEQGFKVYYIEPVCSPLIQIKKKVVTPVVSEKEKNLFVIRPNILLPRAIKSHVFNFIAAYWYYKIIGSQINLGNSDTIIGFNGIYLSNILKFNKFKEKKVFFHCVDNYSEFPEANKKLAIRLEDYLIRRANSITTTTNTLKKRIAEKYQITSILSLGNGVNLEHFIAEESPEIDQSNLSCCYTGAISEWFDFDLIDLICLKFPNIKINVFGWADNQSISEKFQRLIDKYDNLYFHGKVPYNQLPSVIAQSSFCIIPFINSELIKDVDPIKAFEYMAMKKPVISTKWENLKQYQDFMYLAEDKHHFIELIYKVCNSFGTEANKVNVNKAFDFVKTRSWENISKKIIQPYC